MRTTKAILRTASAAALLALVVGGAWALFDVASRRYVLEFQAGAESPWSERLVAIAQRTTIEVLGFALLAAFLAALAAALTALRRPAPGSRVEEGAASFLLAAGSFYAWTRAGTWAAGLALPYLTPGELVALNLAGFAITLAAFLAFDLLARRLPWAPRGRPAACSLASVACASAALLRSLDVVRGRSGGWRDPERLAICAGLFVAALVVAPLLARLLRAPVSALVERLARRPVLPRPAALALGLLLVACVATSAATFRPSAVDSAPDYGALEAPGDPPGPNVVLVTIDTLRADHLGCYGYDRPTSPVLDSIAGEGVRFDDPVAPAAWTKPSTGTILTGLYPSRHGGLYHGSSLTLPPGERTLAQAFRDAGYATAGFVSNPNLKKVFDFDRGFDVYFDSPVEDTVTLASIRATAFGRTLMKLMRHQFNWKYENDVRQMNRHILAWLEENRDQPFFLYLHYIDPHAPYAPPQPWRSEFTQDHGFPLFKERQRLVGMDLYDGEIRYCDTGIGELRDRLREWGLWEDLLFAVTSDHGEEFFENGVIGHGYSLFQEVVRVPLFLRGPGVPAGRVVEDPVEILDLPATLLDLAGTGVERLGDGASFASAARGEEPESEEIYFLENEFGQDEHDIRSFVFTGVRQGPWKLVLTEENAYFPPSHPEYGRQALYNLAEDPDESENVFEREEHEELVQRLLSRLQEHARFLQETGFRDVEPAALDPAVQEELRALGYL